MDKPGIILKICVTNFVTYTYAEMYPGANLNMIVGPNGTGKSTMVAAIILGLGGNPKIVGRGTKISEYVKHNTEQARIDVVLKADDRSSTNTLTITREFDLHEKTTWKVNGKNVSQKDMLEKIKNYNIQVDNLCQFLPQDRVQDFAKMNKQDLLKQTKKALCREDLVEQQENLITRQHRHKDILENFNKKTQKLQEAKSANLRLEGRVTNFNRRKSFLVLVKNIERKLIWRAYEQIAERREEIKNDKTQATDILNTHKKSAAPIEIAIKNAKTAAGKCREKLVQEMSKTKNAETEIQKNSDRLTRLKESINDIKSEEKSQIDEIAQRRVNIELEETKIVKYNNDKRTVFEKYGSVEDVTRKIQQYNGEIRQFQTQIAALESKKSDLLGSKRTKVYEIRGLENEISKIENVKHQRLEYLRRLDADAYNATMWLRENNQNFKGQVFEPMMLELNVINPENAVYIENTIPVRDRVALTCTNKEDMNLLIRLLRDRQNLSVNVVHSDADQSIRMFQPTIPIERLKKYGLYAYLSSLFTGPVPIFTYLCRNYRIHNMPVGNDQTNKCFEDVPKEISNFFSDKFRFSCSFSQYTGEKIVRQNEIKADGCLSISVDLARLENIRGQLNEIQRTSEHDDVQIQEFENQISQLMERKNLLMEHLKTLKSVIQQVETLDSRLRVATNNIAQLNQHNINPDEIKKESAGKIKNVLKQIMQVHKVIMEKENNLASLLNEFKLIQLKITVAERQVTFLENKAYDIRQLIEESETTVRQIKTAYETVTREAKQALQKGKDASNGFTPNQDGFEEFREDYNKLSDNEEELQREKDEIMGRMECINAADEDEIREYEQRAALIEQLEEQIRNDTREVDNVDKKMEQLERNYMEPLEELVEQISRKFSLTFEKLGCAGEVSVYKGENQKDYEQYGLSIKVTYRDGEPLQELNNITQSGGERAVATAIYMLSLQELTPVPFRCVDEINQGMDEINERRIFECLFECTSRPNTSQYFLITPKLISNLDYSRSMKVHFVHNGPFVPSQGEWNRVET